MKKAFGALFAVSSVFVLLASLGVRAQAPSPTPQEWIRLGEQVHGGFGAFLPVGLRIGQDALKRLDAKPREVSVVYYDGEKTPCPCIADGILMATAASPGQGTLRVAAEKAAPGLTGVAVITHRKTGKSVRYSIPGDVMPRVFEWNKAFDPAGRFAAAMKAENIFTVADAN